jgi:Flp pilus assembly protein TadG
MDSYVADSRRNLGAALWACQRGGPLVEFALFGPMVIALLLGILHTALIYMAQQGLQSAADMAGRVVMTGQAQQAGMTQAQFKSAACAALPPFMSCNRLYIDARTVTSFASANTGAVTLTYNSSGAVTNTFSYDLGGRDDIVLVRLMYLWPVANGPFGLNLTNQQGGNRMLAAASVLKTELY